MRAADRIKKIAEAPGERRAHKRFVRSLRETAARAVVTATVTFAVGWALKNVFAKSVAEAAEDGARAGAEDGASPAPPPDADSGSAHEDKLP